MFKRIAFLLVCLAFLGCGDDDAPANGRLDNFNAFWETIDREYSYFEQKGVDWDAVRAEFEPQVNETLTNRQLFDIFSEMVLTLRDGHTGLITSFGRTGFSLDRGTVDNSAVDLNRYVINKTTATSRLTVGEIASQNLLYIGVHSLSGGIDDAQNDALYNSVNRFEDYEGVIIDLRNNGGGNDGIARRFIQGFVDQNRDFRKFRFRQPQSRNSFNDWQTDELVPQNSISYTRPIVVLINRSVVSSAEGMTLMLNALPNVTLMGDRTTGSTGNPGVFELPNGWELYVSRWQVTDLEGNYVEDQGIQPDIAVSISEADRAAGIDSILEAAIRQFD